MVVVLVGVIFVGSIETVWAGEITRPRGKAIKVTPGPASDPVIELQRGEEPGRFNTGGSTIVVLFRPGRVKWGPGFSPGLREEFGQTLGHLAGPAGWA